MAGTDAAGGQRPRRRRGHPLAVARPEPDWRRVAHDLAWSQAGQPHTVEEQAALDTYDRACAVEQRNGWATAPAASGEGCNRG